MGNSSSFFNMKKFAENQWSSKGLLEVQRKEANLFVFRFQSDEAKQSILDLSPIPFGNRVIFLWPWTLNSPIQRLKLGMVPVWLKFPDLRLHYFNTHVLSGLGSFIGKPLFMDKLTSSQSRVSCARICVEIKVGDPLPVLVDFFDEDGIKHSQEVIYEWMPIQCPKCKSFGHNCTAAPQAQANTLPTKETKLQPAQFTQKKQTVPARTFRNGPRHTKSPFPPRHTSVTNNRRGDSPNRRPTTTNKHPVNHKNSNISPLQNKFAPLLSIDSDGSRDITSFRVYKSPTYPTNTSILAASKGHDNGSNSEKNRSSALSSNDSSDKDEEDESGLEYNRTLTEHIRNINAKLDKRDSSWYNSSEEDYSNDSGPSRPPPASMIKSVITKGISSAEKGSKGKEKQYRYLSPSSSRKRSKSRGRSRGVRLKQ